ncbi:hypothetical protein [Gelidibacter salicanalis]|uniref:SGNH/GDSL hydrolase family protein n=1 Tax=Gelidibacter salicanalis TaxID=291193 RepID=A0A934KPL8_9FLAO|nr:hypothetical protein [Gelidibacter salicanalis]MBJ7879146.1 hypothetical protein [Gelidibacter salicanalis]
MGTFIKFFFFFIVIFIGLIAFVSISTSFIERRYSNFKIENNTTSIVIGHSHPECAFNDSLIPNLKNLSQSGESYFYNYFKTKRVIMQNASINVVFVEFTNNQIDESMDDWIWGDKFLSNSYPKYSSFMNADDNLVLFQNNPSAFINALSLSLKTKITKIFENKLKRSHISGGYLHLEKKLTDSIIKNTERLKHEAIAAQKDISEANLSYLDALIEFCTANNKRVILIRSPQHEKYPGYENENKYVEILQTRYANIEYMDFSNFPLTNNEYADLDHLNYKGAKVFSEWFADLLSNGLLEKKNKQDYIDERIMTKSLESRI